MMSDFEPEFAPLSARIRLTCAQALVRWMIRQFVVIDGREVPYFAGVWAIFGHGNVAGIGEALYAAQADLPTYRAHNEQGMAHAAIAFAKQSRRQRAMACTTSIGPGALNMVTAAALAHVNRLPVLFIPGDVFANRSPDPVLQQVEDFEDATISANDAFKPVSRYFDRIVRPEQLISSLPRVMSIMMNAAICGPVTLSICQDVQAEAFDYPVSLFARRVWRTRTIMPDPRDIADVLNQVRQAKAPLIIAGGGVHYAKAEGLLADFAGVHGIPVAETQAGKGALPWDHPMAVGAIGVTGTSAANALAAKADLIIGIGTRLQDFTTGSWALFENPDARLIQINTSPHDAHKHAALAVVSDAGAALTALGDGLSGYQTPSGWRDLTQSVVAEWNGHWDRATHLPEGAGLPTDAQVIGAVWRHIGQPGTVVCAAGGLPGELHKLWRCHDSRSYHVEYGFSCMGYEIAGGLGAKMATPERDICVMVGDGSYLMMNSEIATSVMLGQKLTIIVLDNRGYGCINRLQKATGGAPFNNLLADARHVSLPDIDFASHARSLGAYAVKVSGLSDLERQLLAARAIDRTCVLVIDTDPLAVTEAGGAWWDVAVPEVSDRPEVQAARATYEIKTKSNRRSE